MFLGTVEENNMDFFFSLFRGTYIIRAEEEEKNKLKGSFLKWQVNS